LLDIEYRSESVKTTSHIPSALARRALRHNFETTSPIIALDLKDAGKHVVTANPVVDKELCRRSPVRRRKLSLARQLTVRKRHGRTLSSALACDDAVSAGVCDNTDAVGIRTRRMSAAAADDVDAAAACVNQQTVNLTATENVVNPNSRSQLSSAFTAVTAATSFQTEVAGL